MLRYFSLDIICSSKFTVFQELCSRKTVHFLEQIMSADKYLSIFLRQINRGYCLYIPRTSCSLKKLLEFQAFTNTSPHYLHFYQTEWRTKRFPIFFHFVRHWMNPSGGATPIFCYIDLMKTICQWEKNYPYREINSSLMPCVALISSPPEYHEPCFIYCFYLYT